MRNSNSYHFEESSLLFQFSDNWVVRKFDDHKYYKILSGYGLKGVDFIGILNNEEVYLIEVKNYRRRKQSPVPPKIGQILGDRPELIDAFIGKIEDTISAINVVNKYLLRKRAYRLLIALRQVLPSRWFLHREWFFWTRVHELIHAPNQEMKLVLWLETETDYPDLDEQQLVRLHQLLDKEINTYFQDLTPHFSVASQINNNFDNDLKVVSIVE